MGLQKCMYGELWIKGGRYGRYINFYVYIRLWRYVALSDAILHFGFFLMHSPGYPRTGLGVVDISLSSRAYPEEIL
jgi:hypothetical protein